MDEKINSEFSLEELIEKLEIIKEEGNGPLNFPKSFYCLAKEIEELKKYVKELDEIMVNHLENGK